MNLVYVPETCLGKNVYCKRLLPLKVETPLLKEIPKEATMEYVSLLLRTDLDKIFDQEFMNALIIDTVKMYPNPENVIINFESSVEYIRKLLTAQFIKEQYSEFESEAFLDSKTKVFYVNNVQLSESDIEIGKVLKCSWYNPIRCIRNPGYISSCTSQHSGDKGYFYTSDNVSKSIWHNGIYYFF